MTPKGTARAKRGAKGGVKSRERRHVSPVEVVDREDLRARYPEKRDASDPARVRAESREDRVRHIVEQMLSGEWKGVRSWRALGASWGCSPRTVEAYARDAGMLIANQSIDVAAVRGKVLAEIERVKRLAERKKWQGMPDPDVKTMVRAIELEAKACGVIVQHTKSTVTTVDASALSPRERVAQLRELRQSVEDELAAEEARMAAEERGGELQ